MADRCKSCGAEIEWATSAKTGKAIPLDLGEAVAVPGRPISVLLVVWEGVARPAQLDDPPSVKLRTSHFATCPQAASWRKR